MESNSLTISGSISESFSSNIVFSKLIQEHAAEHLRIQEPSPDVSLQQFVRDVFTLIAERLPLSAAKIPQCTYHYAPTATPMAATAGKYF